MATSILNCQCAPNLGLPPALWGAYCKYRSPGSIPRLRFGWESIRKSSAEIMIQLAWELLAQMISKPPPPSLNIPTSGRHRPALSWHPPRRCAEQAGTPSLTEADEGLVLCPLVTGRGICTGRREPGGGCAHEEACEGLKPLPPPPPPPRSLCFLPFPPSLCLLITASFYSLCLDFLLSRRRVLSLSTAPAL